LKSSGLLVQRKGERHIKPSTSIITSKKLFGKRKTTQKKFFEVILFRKKKKGREGNSPSLF
jgi:hypothetical protein